MRLLTHNQLICVRKGCKDNFPLRIEATKVEQDESDVEVDFIVHMMPRIDYGALLEGARAIGLEGLPAEAPAELSEEKSADVVAALHKALVDTHVQEGKLVCSKCSREYPIVNGIPNMRLNEEEV